MAKSDHHPKAEAASEESQNQASNTSDNPGKAAKFLEGDLMRHVIIMSLSASVGLISMFVVDFVDLYFISLLGQQALAAAVGFAGTLIYFNMSITVGLMIAVSALAARRIGAGDPEGAREVATSVLVLGVGASIIFAGLFWVFTPQLLEMIGASGQTRDYAVRYLRIVVPFMPFMVGAMVCSGLLRAHGDARRAMQTTLSAGITNAILDPILIFGFDMGLDGAAWASVAARIAMMATALWPILSLYDGFALRSFTLERFRAHLPIIFAIAGPALLTNLATPTGTLFVTRAIAEYGDDAVAGFAVIARLMPLAFCVIFALSGAVGPIVGQNFGAMQWDRVRETVRKSVMFTGLYTLAMWFVLFLGHNWIADIFALSGDGRTLLYWFAALAAPLLFFNGVLFVANAAFNNLDRPIWSTWLNWGRNTLGILPFIILGAAIGGAPGVVIGQYAGAVIFAAVGLWLFYRLISNYERGIVNMRTAPETPLTRRRESPPLSSPRG